jgi:hypothetical protein
MAIPIKVTVTLSTLALCALFIADGATSYFATRLFAVTAGDRAANKSGAAPKPPGTEPPSVIAMLRRNMFDPSMGLPPGAGEAPPHKGITDRPTGGAPRKREQREAAITMVSETQYHVKRSLVDELLDEPAALTPLARATLHEENGQAVGVRLYGIRRNGLLGRLGVQNGDVVHSINGMSVADLSSALDALAKLRSASDLKVAITRRDQAVSLRIGITD